jgi:nitrogen regulatory protein P-II 1
VLSSGWQCPRFPCRNEDLRSDPSVFVFCGTQGRVQGSGAPRRASSANKNGASAVAVIHICRRQWGPRIIMTRLEAIVQPSRFGAVKGVLAELGIGGMAVSGVRGRGSHNRHTEVYRGRKYTVDLLPKIKLEMVLPDDLVDPAMAAIRKAASTSSIGEETIFVSKLEETIHPRNQERGALVP